MLDHTRASGQGAGQGVGVSDTVGEPAAGQVVAVVGDERHALFVEPQLGTAAQRRQPMDGRLRTKGRDLDRQWPAPQPFDLLGCVGDDQESFGVNLDDLFAEQGPAQPLDEIEVGVYLVVLGTTLLILFELNEEG